MTARKQRTPRSRQLTSLRSEGDSYVAARLRHGVGTVEFCYLPAIATDALKILTSTSGPRDSVAIVTYAGSARVVNVGPTGHEAHLRIISARAKAGV